MQSGVATVRDRVPLGHGLTVGRQAIPGQVVLDHPNVSRRHAAFEIVNGTVVLRDLGGTNGTYVNGDRLRGARRLVEGDRIDIGPFQLTFDGTALTKVGRIGNVELLVRSVSYDVRSRQARGVPSRILEGANLRILPCEFVAIIGANGSGKSTLMNIMAGRMLPSEGTVLLNNCDLHANFQAVKQDIAFVPQQDVLHEQLTLRQALDYTAQLRLPPDTTVEQRHAAVIDAVRSVDLLDRLDQRIGTLSGGQKKCASLASEILNRPSLLLLDEVTSGLDESTDWQIMRLLRRLADDGVTIIVVTHTLANVAEFCDKVICMGRGGQPTFVGAPSEVLEFFSVHRLGEVFDRTDELGARCWRARLCPRTDPLFITRSMVSGRPMGSSKGGESTKICEDCGTWDVSHDGRKVLYWFSTAKPILSIGLLQLPAKEKVELIQHAEYSLYQPRFFPDDRWIAFLAKTGQDRSRVYVVPF